MLGHLQRRKGPPGHQAARGWRLQEGSHPGVPGPLQSCTCWPGPLLPLTLLVMSKFLLLLSLVLGDRENTPLTKTCIFTHENG